MYWINASGVGAVGTSLRVAFSGDEIVVFEFREMVPDGTARLRVIDAVLVLVALVFG